MSETFSLVRETSCDLEFWTSDVLESWNASSQEGVYPVIWISFSPVTSMVSCVLESCWIFFFQET